MEEICNNTHYKSGWRPLAREDGLVTESTYLAVETCRKKEQGFEPERRPDKAAEVFEPGEILKKLSELCEDIDALNHRVQEQGEKIETLLNLLEEKGTPVRKSAFGLSWK